MTSDNWKKKNTSCLVKSIILLQRYPSSQQMQFPRQTYLAKGNQNTFVFIVFETSFQSLIANLSFLKIGIIVLITLLKEMSNWALRKAAKYDG